MTDQVKYSLTKVEVHVSPTLTVTAQVDSISAVARLLEDLKGLAQKPSGPSDATVGRPAAPMSPEDPLARMETRADLPESSLAKSKIVSVKDDIPQLLRPGLFKTTTEAILVLLFTVETGLQRNPVDYQAFSGLYQAQNLKSGSPLAMIITNLKGDGYLDKKVYSDGRNLRLTARGEQKAIDVLRKLCQP